MLLSRIARARAISLSSCSNARTDKRSATIDPVPSTTSRARRMRSATASDESTQPLRSPASPYDFVRLLVEMNSSPQRAAGSAERSVASRYTSSTSTRAPRFTAIAPISTERTGIGQCAGRVVRAGDDHQTGARRERRLDAAGVERHRPLNRRSNRTTFAAKQSRRTQQRVVSGRFNEHVVPRLEQGGADQEIRARRALRCGHLRRTHAVARRDGFEQRRVSRRRSSQRRPVRHERRRDRRPNMSRTLLPARSKRGVGRVFAHSM